jgi:hypothetical protein
MLGVLIALVLLALAVCVTVLASSVVAAAPAVAADFSAPSACLECAVVARSARDTARRGRGEGSRWADGRAGMVEAMVPGVLDLRVLPVMPARVLGL